ncbi:calcium-binding protein [Apis cerana cerana]|uniref:Calcium-binding protein n=1 Tax=Apis cerana cerana TaxID=94128 RepID=A0A2A3EDL7_APICC|nr:calcium-binding protein [Apis cerana cerana]
MFRCIVRGTEHDSATTIDLGRNNSPVLGQDLIIRFFPYYSLSSSASSIYGCPDKVNGSALTLREARIAANEPVSPRGDKQIADAITVLVGHCEKQISLKVSGESGVCYKGRDSAERNESNGTKETDNDDNNGGFSTIRKNADGPLYRGSGQKLCGLAARRSCAERIGSPVTGEEEVCLGEETKCSHWNSHLVSALDFSRAFDYADAEKKGFLSKWEYKIAMTAVFGCRPEKVKFHFLKDKGYLVLDDFYSASKYVNLKVSVTVWQMIFKELDRYKKGYIDFGEFLRFILPTITYNEVV